MLTPVTDITDSRHIDNLIESLVYASGQRGRAYHLAYAEIDGGRHTLSHRSFSSRVDPDRSLKIAYRQNLLNSFVNFEKELARVQENRKAPAETVPINYLTSSP